MLQYKTAWVGISLDPKTPSKLQNWCGATECEYLEAVAIT